MHRLTNRHWSLSDILENIRSSLPCEVSRLTSNNYQTFHIKNNNDITYGSIKNTYNFLRGIYHTAGNFNAVLELAKFYLT